MMTIIVIAILVTIVQGVVTTRDIGIAPAVTIIVLTSITILVVTAALAWVDRHEPEPTLWRMTAFAWGAGVSIAGTLIINDVLYVLGVHTSVQLATDAVLPGISSGVVIFAPLVEEIAKGLGLLVIYRLIRTEVNGVIDLVIYAGFIGLGFSFVEDMSYMTAQYAEHGTAGLIEMFVLRGLMAAFAHSLFTAFTALGLGFALFSSAPFVTRALAVVCGLGAAISMHGMWNFGAVIGAYDYVYYTFQMPTFFLFIGALVWMGNREATTIRRWSQPYIDAGWFSRDQVLVMMGKSQLPVQISRVNRRKLRNATAALGDLSFLRQRMYHGTAPWNAQQAEADLLQEIHGNLSDVERELRSKLALR